MAALVAGTHVLKSREFKGVDGRPAPAMSMFNPFTAAAAEANAAKAGEAPANRDDIANLKEQMDKLQKQLEQMAGKKQQ